LILSQLDRIVSIFVVKREQKSFAGWKITARTLNGDKRIVAFRKKKHKVDEKIKTLHVV